MALQTEVVGAQAAHKAGVDRVVEAALELQTIQGLVVWAAEERYEISTGWTVMIALIAAAA